MFCFVSHDCWMRARIATERLSTTRQGAPVDQFPKATRSYSEAKGTGTVAACPSRASAGARSLLSLLWFHERWNGVRDCVRT